jgi:hypothetical protein
MNLRRSQRSTSLVTYGQVKWGAYGGCGSGILRCRVDTMGVFAHKNSASVPERPCHEIRRLT